MNEPLTQVDRTVPYKAEVTVATTPSTIGESRLPRPLAIGQRWRDSDGYTFTITEGPHTSAYGTEWYIEFDQDGDDYRAGWFYSDLLGDDWGDTYVGTTEEAHDTLQQVTNTTPHEAWGEDAGL